MRKPGNVEVVQVRMSGLGSPSRREFHEGLGFGTLTASHHHLPLQGPREGTHPCLCSAGHHSADTSPCLLYSTPLQMPHIQETDEP